MCWGLTNHLSPQRYLTMGGETRRLGFSALGPLGADCWSEQRLHQLCANNLHCFILLKYMLLKSISQNAKGETTGVFFSLSRIYVIYYNLCSWSHGFGTWKIRIDTPKNEGSSSFNHPIRWFFPLVSGAAQRDSRPGSKWGWFCLREGGDHHWGSLYMDKSWEYPSNGGKSSPITHQICINFCGIRYPILRQTDT